MFLHRERNDMNLVLSLTEACNLRCKYCYYKESHEDRSLNMSDEILETAVRVAFERTLQLKQSYFNVTFFGGEPLLRKESIFKTVDLINSLKQERSSEIPQDFRARYAVNTNCTLLNDEILEYLRREKFRIFVSLDGPAEHHNIARRTVQGTGSFELLKPFIPALVQMDTVVISVVTRNHVPTLADSVKWIFDQGFKQVTTALDFDGKWTGEDYDALAQQYVKMADFWVARKKENPKDLFYLGTIQDKLKFKLQGLRHKEITCHVFEGAIGVAANGNVFPCTRFITSKLNAPYCLGNVLDARENGVVSVESMERLFNNPVAQDIQDFMQHDKAECDGCAIRYRCHAHECACTSFYTTGSIHEVSAEVCTHERMLAAICDDAAEQLV